MTSIGAWAFDGAVNIKSVISKIKNPFAINGYPNDRTFAPETFGSATLYVPMGTYEKYKTTDGWKDFANIVEGVPTATSITLNYDTYTIEGIGKNVQLLATLLPEDANDYIEWTSSDESVCTVYNGRVTAKGKGTAVITAQIEDSEYKATCTVTVIQPVSSVTLNYESYTLTNIGKSIQLTATILPEDASNKNITWTTSDDAVCMVSSTGKVVATGVGSAVVKATTEDGGFTASCDVTVIISVSGVSLNYTSYTFDEIGKSLQLQATIKPQDLL